MRSRKTGAPPSTCNPWSSETWATTARPVSRSLAILPRATRNFSASSSSTPKAKTWSPAFALRSRSTKSSRHAGAEKLPTLQEVMPKAYKQLVQVYQKLEKHYRDMQDIEFTIERGTLLHAPDPERKAHRRRRAQDRGGHGSRKADHQARSSPSCQFRSSSTSFCTPRWTRKRKKKSSPKDCPHPQEPRPARSFSIPRPPSAGSRK